MAAISLMGASRREQSPGMIRVVLRFAWYCLLFAAQQAWSAAFGWVGPIGGVLAVILGPKLFPVAMSGKSLPDLLFQGFIGAGIAWIFIFILYLFLVAPRRAIYAIRPLSVKISRQISQPRLFQSTIEKHTVEISVRNRSFLKSLYVVVSILEIPEKVGVALPWQIYTGNIPKNDEHGVELASWFYWKGERENYDIQILSERGGAFAEASRIALPQSGSALCIVVRSPGIPEVKTWCKLWIDDSSKRLMLDKSPPFPGII